MGAYAKNMEYVSGMELAEVINPNFALPIVGVLICALLVYAFGFKSSTSPPSFDFQQDTDVKKLRKAKKPKKPISNYIPVEVKNETNSQKQVLKQNPKLEKEPSTVTKLKAKKISNSQRSNQQINKVQDANDSEENEGEWTQAISR